MNILRALTALLVRRAQAVLRPPQWVMAYGMRFMPFAEAASPELPMGRLLRLSLFQMVIGMVTTLLVGTVNRVMIQVQQLLWILRREEFWLWLLIQRMIQMLLKKV